LPILNVPNVPNVPAKKQRNEIAREVIRERAAIREHKAGIIDALKTAINDPAHDPEEDRREAIEERAAILEFEAGYPRDEAERLAELLVQAHGAVIESVSHERRAARCLSCTHFRRPGYSSGYCGSPERRDDLPPAYGEGHPLRQLPGDQGKSCRAYRGEIKAGPVPQPSGRCPALTSEDEAAIRAWLAGIGEDDPETIAEVIERCQQDEAARDYFIGRAGAELPKPPPMTNERTL
jgi:hypothetical protein